MLIFISIAPAADCTNDYTFHRTKYNHGERGNRYLDGFVDCEAASEDNQYYVEDYDWSDEDSWNLYSCFKADGLCLRLTSKNNGGWDYNVFDMAGKIRAHNMRNLLVHFKNFSLYVKVKYPTVKQDH